MENNTPPSKLDETIKENLSNYDAKYDSGDWSRMERMLDSAPKTVVSKGSYNKVLIAGTIVLVGGLLIYLGVNSSKTNTETNVTSTENITAPIITPAPVVTKTTTTITPVIKEKPSVIPEVKTSVPEIKTSVTKIDKPSLPVAVDKKEKVVAEKTKKDKPARPEGGKSKTVPNDNDYNKTQKVSVMGNEPIFGDMIDSSKGIVRETKEKESTKKAAVSKGTKNSSIGLSGLLNLNADSIRKQKEQLQKDTIPK